MVIESSLSGEQISEEIRFTLARLEGKKPMIYVPLDPSATVVLFADLQAGIIERVKTNELTHLRRAVSALAKLTKLFDIPAVLTTAPSEGGAPRVTPEIAAALGELPQYMRTTTDAFLHTATRDAITRTGRKTLIIAGVATEIIVQHSALSAAARGLNVQVVIDACGGLSARTEDAAAPPIYAGWRGGDICRFDRGAASWRFHAAKRRTSGRYSL